MSYCCNTKGRIPDNLKSHVDYEFCCPACNAGCIGKTDWNLGTRIKEHCVLDKNAPIFNQLAKCYIYQCTLTLHNFRCDGDVTLTNQDILGHIRTTVTGNRRIIDRSKNCDELCFLESLNIKWKKPSLNTIRICAFFINLIEMLIPFMLWIPFSLKPFQHLIIL